MSLFSFFYLETDFYLKYLGFWRVNFLLSYLLNSTSKYFHYAQPMVNNQFIDEQWIMSDFLFFNQSSMVLIIKKNLKPFLASTPAFWEELIFIFNYISYLIYVTYYMFFSLSHLPSLWFCFSFFKDGSSSFIGNLSVFVKENLINHCSLKQNIHVINFLKLLQILPLLCTPIRSFPDKV